jgi:hypothetical protein
MMIVNMINLISGDFVMCAWRTGPRDLVLLILILRLPSTPSSCATMSFILLLHPTLSSSKEPPSRPVSPDDTGNTGVESAPTLQTNFEAFTRFKTQHVTDTLLYHLALDIQREYPWAHGSSPLSKQ